MVVSLPAKAVVEGLFTPNHRRNSMPIRPASTKRSFQTTQQHSNISTAYLEQERHGESRMLNVLRNALLNPPILIVILYLGDLALVLAYGINLFFARMYSRLYEFLNLNGEANLPTWFSSMQWFYAAVLFGHFSYRNFKRSDIRTWWLALLAVMFLVLSLDEVAQIHEWLGSRSDALLPGGTRNNTVFHQTGFWIVLLGVPFLVVFLAIAVSIRRYLSQSPGAFTKLVMGMGLMLFGSLVVEAMANFVVHRSMLHAVQISFEELFEMLGITTIVWAGYQLAPTFDPRNKVP
jgi:hypothetical protein